MSEHEQLMAQARDEMLLAAHHVDNALSAVRWAHRSDDARAQGRAEQAAHKAIAELDFAVSYLGHLRIRESERRAAGPDTSGQYVYGPDGEPATRDELAIYRATGAIES